jgi:chromosome segregation ATPase
MEQKVNVNEISVERLISLEKQNATLQQQVGELKSDKKNLEAKIEEGQKEVKIITGKKNTSKWDEETFVVQSVETRNLGDVEEIIRKKYQSDIDKKDSEIRDLSNKVIDNKNSFERSKKEYENEYNNYRIDLRLENEKEIKDLNEEIEKLRNDKTDEQLVAARDNEILEYKKELKELKGIIKDLQSMNIFKLLLAKFTKKVVIVNDLSSDKFYPQNTKSVWDSMYNKWRQVKI